MGASRAAHVSCVRVVGLVGFWGGYRYARTIRGSLRGRRREVACSVGDGLWVAVLVIWLEVDWWVDEQCRG